MFVLMCLFFSTAVLPLSEAMNSKGAPRAPEHSDSASPGLSPWPQRNNLSERAETTQWPSSTKIKVKASHMDFFDKKNTPPWHRTGQRVRRERTSRAGGISGKTGQPDFTITSPSACCSSITRSLIDWISNIVCVQKASVSPSQRERTRYVPPFRSFSEWSPQSALRFQNTMLLRSGSDLKD